MDINRYSLPVRTWLLADSVFELAIGVLLLVGALGGPTSVPLPALAQAIAAAVFLLFGAGLAWAAFQAALAEATARPLAMVNVAVAVLLAVWLGAAHARFSIGGATFVATAAIGFIVLAAGEWGVSRQSAARR